MSMMATEAAKMPLEAYVGRRLSYSSNLCTVRYVGQVKGTRGQWLGVEWDDPNRGKHAGVHEGVKYFDCERGSALLCIAHIDLDTAGRSQQCPYRRFFRPPLPAG